MLTMSKTQLLLFSATFFLFTAVSPAALISHAEITNRSASAEAEQTGEGGASVTVNQTGINATDPLSVRAEAHTQSQHGLLKNEVSFVKDRTNSTAGFHSDFGGSAISDATFQDAITITPSDNSLTGNTVHLKIRISAVGSGSISGAEGPSGRLNIFHNFSVGRYDLSDPSNILGSSGSSNNAEVRFNSSGVPFDEDFATVSSTDYLASVSFVLGEQAGFYGTQNLTATVGRDSGGTVKVVSGTIEGFFATTYKYEALVDDFGNPLDLDDFTFTSATGTDYFNIVPEPTSALMSTLALALVCRRKR